MAPVFTKRTQPDLRLAGRRIVITGGASGIGRRSAEIFVEEGASVAILDRNETLLKEVAGSTGAHAFPFEVTDEASVEAAIKAAADAMGGIDGLVNSVGVNQHNRRDIEGTPLAEWERLIAINLTGPYLVCRAALSYLKANSGTASIVNVSSGAGLMPAPAGPSYGAAKAGLIMLSYFLAAELGPDVRVNSVSPGATETPLLDEVRKEFGIPPGPMANALQRTASADEIARAILFLTSREASYVTGAGLTVDGGRTYR